VNGVQPIRSKVSRKPSEQVDPTNSSHRQLAGGGFGIGKNKGFGSPFGAHSWQNRTNASNEQLNYSTGAKRFSMVVSLRRNRGSKIGKTKRGKGTKWMMVVDGEDVVPFALIESAVDLNLRDAQSLVA
jgi:hypothetical protein